MIIRAAVVDSNKKRAAALKRSIVTFSLKSSDYGQDIDVDVAEYKTFGELLSAYCMVDIAFLSYGFLQENADHLDALYKSNSACIPVPVGFPADEICQYLDLRPGGHLKTVNEQAVIAELCQKCAHAVAEDNRILQIASRQGCYAVSVESILYCMSNQKYISIVTKNGFSYRKLGKLDDFAVVLPDYFLRIHQRFLVNYHHFSGIDKSNNNWTLLLDTGDRIPISRVYQKSVDEQFKKLHYSCQK